MVFSELPISCCCRMQVRFGNNKRNGSNTRLAAWLMQCLPDPCLFPSVSMPWLKVTRPELNFIIARRALGDVGSFGDRVNEVQSDSDTPSSSSTAYGGRGTPPTDSASCSSAVAVASPPLLQASQSRHATLGGPPAVHRAAHRGRMVLPLEHPLPALFLPARRRPIRLRVPLAYLGVASQQPDVQACRPIAVARRPMPPLTISAIRSVGEVHAGDGCPAGCCRVQSMLQ